MWLRITEIKLPAERLRVEKNKNISEYELSLIKKQICRELDISLEQGQEYIGKIEIYRKSPDIRKKAEPALPFYKGKKLCLLQLHLVFLRDFGLHLRYFL